MTKKDFVFFADLIRDEDLNYKTAKKMIEYFKSVNPNFNVSIFNDRIANGR